MSNIREFVLLSVIHPAFAGIVFWGETAPKVTLEAGANQFLTAIRYFAIDRTPPAALAYDSPVPEDQKCTKIIKSAQRATLIGTFNSV